MTYSLEERKKAVELYEKYGCSAADTIRELGYPNRHTLANWYKEHKENGKLSDPKPRQRKYTDDQKRTAVDYYLEHGKSIARTRRALGYPSKQYLAEWIDELAPGMRKTYTTSNRYKASDDEVIDAVIDLVVRDVPASEVAKSHGVTRETLYFWKYKLLGKEMPCMSETKDSSSSNLAELEARIAELEADVRRLELKKAILEGTVELLGKDPGADPNRLTNREKVLLIDSIRPDWPLKALLAEVGLARSSYQYQIAAIARGDRHAELREAICEVFDANDGAYGRRRIHDELAANGIVAGEHLIASIMSEEHLIARGRKRKRGYNSYKGELSEHPGNLVNRDFTSALPNFLWLTDITQFSIPAGKVYLSPVIDCFDGMVVSWTIGTSPSAEFANTMLRSAIETLSPGDTPILHSDCGCHYRWPGWISICEDAGIVRSISKKGCSPDNSACEGFFGRLKNEFFYGRNWSDVTIDEFMERLDAYMHWYNEKRIKRSLGGMSPVDYRRSLGLAA